MKSFVFFLRYSITIIYKWKYEFMKRRIVEPTAYSSPIHCSILSTRCSKLVIRIQHTFSLIHFIHSVFNQSQKKNEFLSRCWQNYYWNHVLDIIFKITAVSLHIYCYDVALDSIQLISVFGSLFPHRTWCNANFWFKRRAARKKNPIE